MRAALAAFVLASAACVAAAEPEPDTLRDRAEVLSARFVVGECRDALEGGRALFRSRDFSRLKASWRKRFSADLAECAYAQEEFELARDAALRAGALGARIAAFAEIAIATSDRRFEGALGALRGLARNAPGSAEKLGESVVRELRQGVELTGDRRQLLSLHEALLGAGFRSADAAGDAFLRLEHASLLLDRGEIERARERLGATLPASSVIAIRIDKRFDPLRKDLAFEDRLDVARAAAADLARAQRGAAANPRRLQFVMEQSIQLRQLARDDAAIELTENALRRDSADTAHFKDRADHVNWVLNVLAEALYAANRPEEARAAFERAIEFGEGGNANVSQTINYAMALADEGQPERALDVIGRLGRASRYGEMWAAALRVCAYEQMGNRAKRDEAIAFLAANETANAAARMRGLLCANELDGAVALYLRRLANPALRGSALEALQNYRVRATPALPQREILRLRLARVRERPELQRAALAVGRIEQIPLRATYYGDL